MMATDGRGDWRKFICLACGYVYDEEVGDVDGGLPAGTRFEDIPDDWQCPLCGVKKSDFEPYEQAEDAVLDVIEFTDDQAGIVIVGAGLAGWSVVEALRAIDDNINITLISADDADRYHKPMLSAAISQQKTPSDLVRTTGMEAAKVANIRLVANTFVTNIDAQSQQVHTTRGIIGYDDLVLAIGATPAYPPTICPDSAWHINHLQRFSGLQNRLKDGKKHIAIVGAGMVGTEFAEDLRRAGHAVTLIDVSTYPLSALLPKVAGERILNAIVDLGVDFMGETMVQAVHHDEHSRTLQLMNSTDGQTQSLTVDEIVVATGLMIDERLPIRAGIAFDRRTGIVVDKKTLQTNMPHIYAIGDSISIDGVPCRYVAPHRAQAAAIASHILQGMGNYEHKPPMIRLKNKSIAVTAHGLPKADGNWHVVNDDMNELSLEMHQDGQVIAKALLKTPIKS